MASPEAGQQDGVVSNDQPSLEARSETRSRSGRRKGASSATHRAREPRRGARGGNLSFVEWLKSVPKTYTAFSAAVAAVVGFLAPLRILPEPLVDFYFIPSALAIVAFVLTWVWRDQIPAHLKGLTAGTVLSLVTLIMLNLRYVRSIDYEGTDARTVYYLIGETVVNPRLCGSDYKTIISQCGGTWNALHAAWGTSFTIVAFSYVFAYGFFVIGLIMTTGGIGLARPAKT